VSGFSGTAGDSLRGVNDMMFSTKGRDNGQWANGNCAEDEARKGGWWFRSCSYSQLNGVYYNQGTFSGGNRGGIYWYHYRNNYLPNFAKVYMKIRQKA